MVYPTSRSTCATTEPAGLLQIGDVVPRLGEVTWLAGHPVSKFRAGHVYVVEFWATWCSPCVRASVLLNELAAKFSDRVVIASISTRESEKSASRGTDAVLAFLRRKQFEPAYSIGVDTPRDDIYNEWVSAAGLDQIPLAFLIDQESRLAWVGDPVELEKPIVAVLEGKSDLQ